MFKGMAFNEVKSFIEKLILKSTHFNERYKNIIMDKIIDCQDFYCEFKDQEFINCHKEYPV